jgi:hypothetical protein
MYLHLQSDILCFCAGQQPAIHNKGMHADIGDDDVKWLLLLIGNPPTIQAGRLHAGLQRAVHMVMVSKALACQLADGCSWQNFHSTAGQHAMHLLCCITLPAGPTAAAAAVQDTGTSRCAVYLCWTLAGAFCISFSKQPTAGAAGCMLQCTTAEASHGGSSGPSSGPHPTPTHPNNSAMFVLSST